MLEVNNSNKNDVIKLLGQPHSKSITEKNTWIYIERTRTKGSVHKVRKNVLLNNNVLDVKFDPGNNSGNTIASGSPLVTRVTCCPQLTCKPS